MKILSGLRDLSCLKYFKDDQGKLTSSLCCNRKIPWSVAFIAQFEKLWYWDCLGENDWIRYDADIQHAFRKYLDPVNAWLGYHATDLREEASSRQTSQEEVCETDREESEWTFEKLMSCEAEVDFEELGRSGKIWWDCFGDLNDEDVDAILGDRMIHEAVVSHIKACELALEASGTGSTLIPECLTFEYFLEHEYNKQ